MNFKKGMSLALTVALLGSGSLAYAESGKEEVIYAVLDGQGQVSGLYAVNIFEGGDIVDYGDYSAVHPLNTETVRCVSTATLSGCIIRGT